MGFLRWLLGRDGDANSPKSPDGSTLAELAKRAADMSISRDTNHYLYLPTEEAARAVAASVAQPGRNITTRRAATGAPWLVLVNAQLVVNEATIAEARHEFSAAVAPCGGDYDGWEAAAG